MIYICVDNGSSMGTGSTVKEAYDSLMELYSPDEIVRIENCQFYEAQEVNVVVKFQVSKKAVK